MTGQPMPVVIGASVYPASVASTRLRVHQLRPAVTDAGMELRTWSFFHEDDIQPWFGRSNVRRALALLRGLLRIPSLLSGARAATVVVVQREVLPVGPPILEQLMGRWRPLVWDIDDSLWEGWPSPTAALRPRWLRATGDKYGAICRRAAEIWAGSEVLASWCRARNENVVVIPTVVDVEPTVSSEPRERVVGWIGSHSTGTFVEQLLPIVNKVEPPVTVVVVGARPIVPDGLACEILDWSEEVERETLRRCAVGLYPIDRTHPLAEGKCGLKAVLFMAAGVPVVTTPTTTNASIVRDGVDGMHACDDHEWVTAVEELLEDEGRWRRMSESAHRRALESYSVQVWGPIAAARLRAVAG